jgi:hypothetical protein
VTVCSVGWRMSRSAGDRRCWWSRSAAIAAPVVGMCGAKTPAGRPTREQGSRRGLRWALEGVVVQHLTVARVAEGLGVSWNTANDAVLTEGRVS